MTVVPFRPRGSGGRSEPVGLSPAGRDLRPSTRAVLVLDMPPRLLPMPFGLWQATAITTGVLWLRAFGVRPITVRVNPP